MKRVLITPLDWGLGHATRCIPIIRELLNRSCVVLIGGSGESLAVLKKEFPTLKVFELPPYNPIYHPKGRMVQTMLSQLPKFIRAISREHQALERITHTEKVDLVISDNRYGCWSEKVPCVLITHQSNVLMPKRFGALAPMIRFLVARMIRRFDQCWIPDVEGSQNFSGDMVWRDHAIPTRYIGRLSRFTPRGNAKKQYDLLCVLSGPEPQRTLLETILVKQINSYSGKTLLVRGLPLANGDVPLKTSADVRNFLSTSELQEAIDSARLVIARSGFSSVMDLSRMGSRVVFVPTPGQTEQEYLAGRLKKMKVAFSLEQENFDLNVAITQADDFTGFVPDPADPERLRTALDEVLLK